MAKHSNLIYALKDGAITSIADVQSGLKCDCVCPACGDSLVARKGSKRIHHFAHHTEDNCDYGYEYSLHLAAQEILAKAKKLTIPPVHLHFPDSYKEDELIAEELEINIDRVELEKRISDIVPDIVVYSGSQCLLVEIFVTHPIDDIKLSKIQEADISTIVIDLSNTEHSVSVEEFSEILLGSHEKKIWKYNSRSNRYLKRFLKHADRMQITTRGYTWHIDGCPIASRRWKGRPYANFYDECLYCEYCISHQKFLCTGRERISLIKDLDVPIEIRIRDSNARRHEQMIALIAKDHCPNCGGRLIERNGPSGPFRGCSQFPHCRFTAPVKPQNADNN